MCLTLRRLTDFVTMVTEVTWSGGFILTHCPNTPTLSLIFNNFLKTIFNQGAVFQHRWWNVLFSMSNTHESHPQCLKKDLIRESLQEHHMLCKSVSHGFVMRHTRTQAAMWTDGWHSCALVCSCDLLCSMGHTHTPFHTLYFCLSSVEVCVCTASFEGV